jgi:SAM-dependent methyltransferase
VLLNKKSGTRNIRKKWSRSPKHILRLYCLIDLIKGIKSMSFLEIGAGYGDFTKYFLKRGFYGICYDIGSESRKLLRENLNVYGDRIEVVDTLATLGDNKYESLMAFEVLEHIEYDKNALLEWNRYLCEGGMIILSVPAHKRKYSIEDKRVGHIRRYERFELKKLLLNTGFSNIKIFNYGFPLCYITRPISLLFAKSHNKDEKLSYQERSEKSGVERIGVLNRLSLLINEFTLLPFIILQKIFYANDLGDGYVAIAFLRK